MHVTDKPHLRMRESIINWEIFGTFHMVSFSSLWLLDENWYRLNIYTYVHVNIIEITRYTCIYSLKKMLDRFNFCHWRCSPKIFSQQKFPELRYSIYMCITLPLGMQPHTYFFGWGEHDARIVGWHGWNIDGKVEAFIMLRILNSGSNVIHLQSKRHKPPKHYHTRSRKTRPWFCSMLRKHSSNRHLLLGTSKQ